MRVALVGPLIEENLAVGYLSAALCANGHDAQAVSFVRDEDHAAVARRVLAIEPDAVGLSMAFQSRAGGYIALAEDLRAFGFRGHVTAGGHFASLAAERLLAEHGAIDSVIQGEGEDAIVALADALASAESLERIPGIVWRDGAGFARGPTPVKREDLDALPPPVRSGAPRVELDVPVAPLIASRGCRGKCAYCSIATFGRLARGSVRRERSPEAIAAEMRALWRDRGVRIFVFHDDDFFAGDPAVDRDRIDRLAAAMAAAELPRVALSIKARPDDVAGGLFERLQELGLVQVVLGIDNDSPATLRSLDRCLSPSAQRDALAALHQLDLSVGSNLLLWAPEATLADLRHNLALMAQFPGQLFNVGRAEPYEGAPMTLKLAKQDRLLGDYLGRDYVLGDPAAELAWQLFRRTLADRCYRPDGLMQLGIRLDWWGRLLRHLFPSARADELAERTRPLTARIAASTRAWLGAIIELADGAGGGDPVRMATALAEPIRADDEALSADALALMERLLHAARDRAHRADAGASPTRPRRRASLRGSVAAAGLFAACTCAACVARAPAEPPHQPVAQAPESPDAPEPVADTPDAPPPEQQAPPDDRFAKPPPPRHKDPDAGARRDDGKIQFRMEAVDVNSPSCGGCSMAMGIEILSYRLSLTAPDGYELDHFTVGSGAVHDAVVSPNGRRVWGMLLPGRDPGNYDLVAVFRDTADNSLIKTTQPYRVASQDELRCEPSPCSDPPGPMPGDRIPIDSAKQKPPKLKRLGRKGKVVLTQSRAQTGRSENGVPVLDFGVGLAGERKGDAKGDPKTVPEVTCTAGHPLAINRGDERGFHDWFRVTYSPAPLAGGRMKGGVHECTVTYPADAKGKPQKATLRIRVTDDGQPELAE